MVPLLEAREGVGKAVAPEHERTKRTGEQLCKQEWRMDEGWHEPAQ